MKPYQLPIFVALLVGASAVYASTPEERARQASADSPRGGYGAPSADEQLPPSAGPGDLPKRRYLGPTLLAVALMLKALGTRADRSSPLDRPSDMRDANRAEMIDVPLHQ